MYGGLVQSPQEPSESSEQLFAQDDHVLGLFGRRPPLGNGRVRPHAQRQDMGHAGPADGG